MNHCLNLKLTYRLTTHFIRLSGDVEFPVYNQNNQFKHVIYLNHDINIEAFFIVVICVHSVIFVCFLCRDTLCVSPVVMTSRVSRWSRVSWPTAACVCCSVRATPASGRAAAASARGSLCAAASWTLNSAYSTWWSSRRVSRYNRRIQGPVSQRFVRATNSLDL